MEVYFDWELDDKVKEPLHKWVYEDLRTFIKSRYKLLEEKIDNATDENHPAFVGVIWHEDGSIEIRPFNIAEQFREKLANCLSYEDMDYIMETIGRKIDSKGSEN